MEETLVCNTKYMSPAQETHDVTFINKLDQYIPQFLSIQYYLPGLNVEVIINTMTFHRDVSTL